MTDIDDARVSDGLTRQLQTRREQLEQGATALGWKAGYGTQVVMEKLSLKGPIIGFLTEGKRLDDGGEIDVSAMTAPSVEAEIAVRLGHDVTAGATRDEVAAAIDAIAPAIELVDFNGPREAIADVMAGNIFHQAVVLGAWDEDRAGAKLDGITAELHVNGEAIATDVDPTALIGDPVEVVRSLAELLGNEGERLRAGEVVITGASIAPPQIESGDQVLVRYAGLGDVTLRTR